MLIITSFFSCSCERASLVFINHFYAIMKIIKSNSVFSLNPSLSSVQFIGSSNLTSRGAESLGRLTCIETLKRLYTEEKQMGK